MKFEVFFRTVERINSTIFSNAKIEYMPYGIMVFKLDPSDSMNWIKQAFYPYESLSRVLYYEG